MQLLNLLTFGALATASPLHILPRQSNTIHLSPQNMTSIYTCNGAPFAPSKYTCYNGQLCPVINGRRTKTCGIACYDPMFYGCTNGILQQVYNGTYLNGSAASTGAVSASVYPASLSLNFAYAAPTATGT